MKKNDRYFKEDSAQPEKESALRLEKNSGGHRGLLCQVVKNECPESDCKLCMFEEDMVPFSATIAGVGAFWLIGGTATQQYVAQYANRIASDVAQSLYLGRPVPWMLVNSWLFLRNKAGDKPAAGNRREFFPRLMGTRHLKEADLETREHYKETQVASITVQRFNDMFPITGKRLKMTNGSLSDGRLVEWVETGVQQYFKSIRKSGDTDGLGFEILDGIHLEGEISRVDPWFHAFLRVKAFQKLDSPEEKERIDKQSFEHNRVLVGSYHPRLLDVVRRRTDEAKGSCLAKTPEERLRIADELMKAIEYMKSHIHVLENLVDYLKKTNAPDPGVNGMLRDSRAAAAEAEKELKKLKELGKKETLTQ